MARRKAPVPPLNDDEIFGGSPDADEDLSEVPAFDQGEQPPAELVALGAPPADAIGIQKWNYQMISTMIALTAKDATISNAERMKRIAKLSIAAAKHYPEAAKYDLAQKIAADAEELAGKKRARAAAKMERRPPAGGAKVIPLRPNDQEV